MSNDNPTRVGNNVIIYPRGKKGTYVADLWQDGVHRRVSLKTSNKKVAVERAIKLAADMHQGAYRPAPAAVPAGRRPTTCWPSRPTAGPTRRSSSTPARLTTS